MFTGTFKHLVFSIITSHRCWWVVICLWFVQSPVWATSQDPKQLQPLNHSAQLEIIRLTSLDWAPYTGATLPNGGETTELLRQVFLDIGYQLQVDFLPWNNAVNQVLKGEHGYVAYYPEYPVQDPKLLLSGAIGYSELGLVELKEKPLLLTSFLTLANHRFGVVQDYLNMTELDLLIAAKKLRPRVNRSDKDNVLQVATGELDAAVIDKRVLHYLLKNDAEVQAAAAGRVQFSQSLREHKSLHLVFVDTPQNRRLVQKFNQQLQQRKVQFLPKAPAIKSS
jgi:polar amino acid transport system substrate-binding protein